MGQLPSWDEMVNGDCPLCDKSGDIDEFSFKIADLSASTLYLERDQTYAGYCVLIFNKRHVTGIEHLTSSEYDQFTKDLKTVADAIYSVFKPDHMNYASLGNVIPHLHTHIIPRYKNDPRWRGPIWLSRLEDMQHSAMEDDDAYLKRVQLIQASLNI